ncbi:MAG: Lrp/AsnC family transcriptional regulator [bacterium]
MNNNLTTEERSLLHSVQAGLPAVSHPFEHVGRQCRMEEAGVLAHLRAWKDQGLVRWLGAIFSTHALGYQSTLAAFSLPADRVAEAAGIINQHPGVTHNYQRDHTYNLWFTLATPAHESIKAHLERLARTSGAKKWINLPVVKTYKISLVLPLASAGQAKGPAGPSPSDDRVYSVTDEEKSLIRILQEDWPLVPEPFRIISEQWGGADEQSLIEKVDAWKKLGIIRRIAAILRHHNAGFTVNWMVAWQVEEIDAAGELAARNPLISHCYQRAVAGDWTYPLFTMLHARSEEEARKTVAELHGLIKPVDYKILPTVREFKKIRLKLFDSGY